MSLRPDLNRMSGRSNLCRRPLLYLVLDHADYVLPPGADWVWGGAKKKTS